MASVTDEIVGSTAVPFPAPQPPIRIPLRVRTAAFLRGVGSVLEIMPPPRKYSCDVESDPMAKLPDPAALAKYEQLAPGSAARILAEFEADAAHRREQERIALAAQIADTRRGQIFGLVIGLATVVSGAVTAIQGFQLAGGFIGGGGVIGLVAVFVYGRATAPKA